MNRSKLFVTLLLVTVMMSACTGKSDTQSPKDVNLSNEVEQAVDGTTEEEADATELLEEEPSDPQSLDATNIIEGFNIAPAVTVPSLKEAYQDYFRFGVGLNGTSPSNDTVQSEAMREIIKHHFNSVTYSNLMKPSYLLDHAQSMSNAENGVSDPAVNFNTVLAGLDFAKDNNIQMRGHTLVWHAQTPDWFFREGYRSNGEFVDKNTMLERMESYIKQVLEFTQTEYPGVMYSWDVVNEAVEIKTGHYETETGLHIRTMHGDDLDNLWYKIVGVDYVEKAFEYARKYADEEVKLFYNDYNTFQPLKTSSIYQLVSGLKEKGIIDGIGMQGYMGLDYPRIVSGHDNIADAINTFSELELEIHITELTISSDDKSEASMNAQANRYKELFQLLTELDTNGGGSANITSVTVFGLMDEYMFYANDKNYSRLFDGQLQPKPAFYSIMSVVE